LYLSFNLRLAKTDSLLQDDHLLRGCVAFCLQGIEVGTIGYSLTCISLTIPIDGS